jgi:hypothetical protein
MKQTNLVAEMRDPKDLFIVGVDTQDGEEHELWDARSAKKLDAQFVDNIDKYGIENPITVRDCDGKLEVIDGRQRLKAARKLKLGMVPVIVARNRDARGLNMALNAAIVADAPSELAKRIARYVAHVGDTPSKLKLAAVTFATSVDRIKANLAVAAAPDFMKRAIDSGKTSLTAAAAVAGLPDDVVQHAILNVGPGSTFTVSMAEALKKEVNPPKAKASNGKGVAKELNPYAKSTLRSVGVAYHAYMREGLGGKSYDHMVKFAEEYDPGAELSSAEGFLAGLAFAGGEGDLSEYKHLKKLFEAVLKEKPKAPKDDSEDEEAGEESADGGS